MDHRLGLWRIGTSQRGGRILAKSKIDTRTIGLDTGLAFARWLTGKEHLHYGLWTGLEPIAANVGAAQTAYSDRLLALLPAQSGLRILDIGGGAGETAKRLLTAGHRVEIVVPSAYLAERCRINAPTATVHECRFEDLTAENRFDVCLFSESFQYIPLPLSLKKAQSLLLPNGQIIIGDCFRSDGFKKVGNRSIVGGGHKLHRFREALAAEPLDVVSEQDITEAVAPSIDLEQALFNVIGIGLSGMGREMAAKRPWQNRALQGLLSITLRARGKERLSQRFFETSRNAELFCHANRYLLLKLSKRG